MRGFESHSFRHTYDNKFKTFYVYRRRSFSYGLLYRGKPKLVTKVGGREKLNYEHVDNPWNGCYSLIHIAVSQPIKGARSMGIIARTAMRLNMDDVEYAMVEPHG